MKLNDTKLLQKITISLFVISIIFNYVQYTENQEMKQQITEAEAFKLKEQQQFVSNFYLSLSEAEEVIPADATVIQLYFESESGDEKFTKEKRKIEIIGEKFADFPAMAFYVVETRALLRMMHEYKAAFESGTEDEIKANTTILNAQLKFMKLSLKTMREMMQTRRERSWYEVLTKHSYFSSRVESLHTQHLENMVVLYNK
jgi:hypothetical protein